MLAEQWAASSGSRPASAAAIFGGAVADPHNRTLTALPAQGTARESRKSETFTLAMFFPLLGDHSAVSPFHDLPLPGVPRYLDTAQNRRKMEEVW